MTDAHASPDRLAALEAEVAALKVDNARLRRLLDHEGMPDALRHAFRDTALMLRTIMRRTAETSDDVEGYNAHLGGRLDAIVRVRIRTDAFGEADLRTVISDELTSYLLREDEQVTLSGPEVRLLPRAAEVFGLAIHELATNAVEHGSLGAGAGHLSVAWSVEAGERSPDLALRWEEKGGSAASGPNRRGFGTVVIEEMLPYDLAGQTSLSYEPDGLRCTVRFPLDEATGRLAPPINRP